MEYAVKTKTDKHFTGYTSLTEETLCFSYTVPEGRVLFVCYFTYTLYAAAGQVANCTLRHDTRQIWFHHIAEERVHNTVMLYVPWRIQAGDSLNLRAYSGAGTITWLVGCVELGEEAV